MNWLRNLLSGKKKRPGVMIVDDDEDIRQVVRQMIETEDFGEICDAADGETAINLAYTHRPRLVILDYLMPNMDGEAVARAIRRLVPDSRIVVLSGVLMEKPAWADLYLNKTEITSLVSLLSVESASTN